MKWRIFLLFILLVSFGTKVEGGVDRKVNSERFPHLDDIQMVNEMLEKEGYGVILVHSGLPLEQSEGVPSALTALSTFPNTFPSLRVGHLDSSVASREVRRAGLALFERCSGVPPPEDLFEVASASGGHREKVFVSYDRICVAWTGEASDPVAILALGKELENAAERVEGRWEWARVEAWESSLDVERVCDSEWWRRRRPHLIVYARTPEIQSCLESVAGLIGSDVAIGIGTRRGLARRLVARIREREGVNLSGLEAPGGTARLILPDKSVFPVPQHLLASPQSLALWIRAHPMGSLQEMRTANIRAVWRIFQGPVLIGWADSKTNSQGSEALWVMMQSLSGSLADTGIPLVFIDISIIPSLLERIGGQPTPYGLPAIGFFSRSLTLKLWFRGTLDDEFVIQNWVADALAGQFTFDPQSALAPVEERLSHPITGEILSHHLLVLVGHTLDPLALRDPSQPVFILFYNSETERHVHGVDVLSLWSNLAQVCHERDIPVTVAALDVAENAIVSDMIWGASLDTDPSAIFFASGRTTSYPLLSKGPHPSFDSLLSWLVHSVLDDVVGVHDDL